MTDREAMQMALEALDKLYLPGELNRVNAAITALRARLAEPEPEPVAWMTHSNEILPLFHKTRANALVWHRQPVPLYTAPPTRRPLTDEEIMDAVRDADLDWQTGWSLDEDASNRYITFARAIEAAHGIKEER